MGKVDIKTGNSFRGIQGSYLTWIGVALIALLSGHRSAIAGSASAPLGVTVTVISNCTVATSSDIGGRSPTISQATRDLGTRISVTTTCFDGSGPVVSMGLGNDSVRSGTTVSTANVILTRGHSTVQDEQSPMAAHQPGEQSSSRTAFDAEKSLSFSLSDGRPSSQTFGTKNNEKFVLITVNF